VLFIALIFTFTSHPLLFHIRQGQVDLYVSALIMLAFISYQRSNRLLTGLSLSLAFLIKVNPILLLLTFIIYFKDIKVLLYFLASCLTIVLASFLFLPPRFYSEYFLHILPTVSEGSAYIYNQSLFRLFYSWQVQLEPEVLSGVQSQLGIVNGMLTVLLIAVVPGSLFFLARRIVNTAGRLPEWMASEYETTIFFINILAILLFTSRSWHMVFVWAILPMSRLMVGFLEKANVWFALLTGLSFTMINAAIYEEPVLDSLNMIGSLFAFILLAVLVLKPTTMLRSLDHAFEIRSRDR
jgi:hypothetical protein